MSQRTFLRSNSWEVNCILSLSPCIHYTTAVWVHPVVAEWKLISQHNQRCDKAEVWLMGYELWRGGKKRKRRATQRWLLAVVWLQRGRERLGGTAGREISGWVSTYSFNKYYTTLHVTGTGTGSGRRVPSLMRDLVFHVIISNAEWLSILWSISLKQMQHVSSEINPYLIFYKMIKFLFKKREK